MKALDKLFAVALETRGGGGIRSALSWFWCHVGCAKDLLKWLLNEEGFQMLRIVPKHCCYFQTQLILTLSFWHEVSQTQHITLTLCLLKTPVVLTGIIWAVSVFWHDSPHLKTFVRSKAAFKTHRVRCNLCKQLVWTNGFQNLPWLCPVTDVNNTLMQ